MFDNNGSINFETSKRNDGSIECIRLTVSGNGLHAMDTNCEKIDEDDWAANGEGEKNCHNKTMNVIAMEGHLTLFCEQTCARCLSSSTRLHKQPAAALFSSLS